MLRTFTALAVSPRSVRPATKKVAAGATPTLSPAGRVATVVVTPTGMG
jgi:hypothetical protein